MKHVALSLLLLTLLACNSAKLNYSTHCLPNNYIVLGDNNGHYTWCIPGIDYIHVELYDSIENAVDAGVEHYYNTQDMKGINWDWYTPQCYQPSKLSN
jgi:hypothetical protein